MTWRCTGLLDKQYRTRDFVAPNVDKATFWLSQATAGELPKALRPTARLLSEGALKLAYLFPCSDHSKKSAFRDDLMRIGVWNGYSPGSDRNDRTPCA